MHKRPLFRRAASIAVLALSLSALAGCDSKPETVVAAGPSDPDADTVANAAPVALPPMVTASRTYRCKDNSLVYIDFFSNNTAVYRTDKTGTPTTLTAEGPGKPYKAEGYSVSGEGTEISLTAPGKGSTNCKA